MLKSIRTMIKKECNRFLKDKRIIFSVILLPGLLMYGLYSVLGLAVNSLLVDEDYRFQCYVQNAPEAYRGIFEENSFVITEVEDPEAAKQSVSSEKADLLVIFPADFDQQLGNTPEGQLVPNIEVYYNFNNLKSFAAYELFLDATDMLESSYSNVLDINRGVDDPDLTPESGSSGSMIPMLVIWTLFGSCASLAPESIAGEKERGTFATLLVTPVSRSAIAIGKIISLSFFTLLAGLSTFTGMILGMRNLMPEGTDGMILDYGLREYGLLLVLIVSAVLMTISLISVVSALARSVKEASTIATVVTAAAAIGSFVSSLSSPASLKLSCIPIIGTAVSLNDILTLNYATGNIIAACLSNVVFTGIMLVVLTKLFNSERVMFKK